MKGFSALELLVAFGVVSIVSVFVFELILFDKENMRIADTRLNLLLLAQMQLKTEEVISKLQFEAVVSTTTSDSTTTLEVKVTAKDPFTKEVQVIAHPTDGDLKTKAKVVLGRTLYDFSRKSQQSTCSREFVHAWNEPYIESSFSPFTASSSGTSLKIQNNIAYVGVNSPIKNDADIYLFDVSDPSHIQILSSIDTGPGVTGVALSWPYLYVANTSINAQLQIIDVSNPKTPLLKVSYKLPGGFKDVGYVGNSIFVYGNLVVLATRKSDGPEVHLIDISNRVVPQEVSTYEVGSSVNSLFITGTKLAMATPLDTELFLLDISDTHNPHFLSSYNAKGASGSGNSLYVLGGTLFLGRTLGERELMMFDISATSSIQELSSVLVKTSIEDVLVRSSFIFLSTIDSSKQFQVWSSTSSYSSSFLSSLQLNGRGVALDCEREHLFVITDGKPSFYSITSL